ncbi:hypothetical protein [Vibrio panuliri]|nr:hypothetical protein [Vibrio panuliri]
MADFQNVKDKKEVTALMCVASSIGYEMIKGKNADKGSYGREFLN